MKSNAPGAESMYTCSCFIHSAVTSTDQQVSPELDKRFNNTNTVQILQETEASGLAPCIPHLYIFPHHGGAFQICLNIYLAVLIVNRF